MLTSVIWRFGWVAGGGGGGGGIFALWDFAADFRTIQREGFPSVRGFYGTIYWRLKNAMLEY